MKRKLRVFANKLFSCFAILTSAFPVFLFFLFFIASTTHEVLAYFYEGLTLLLLYTLFILIFNRYLLPFIFLIIFYALLLVLNRLIIDFYGRSIGISDFYLWLSFDKVSHYAKQYFHMVFHTLVLGVSGVFVILMFAIKLYKNDKKVFRLWRTRLAFFCVFLMAMYLSVATLKLERIANSVSGECRFIERCSRPPIIGIVMQASHMFNIDENLKKDLGGYNQARSQTNGNIVSNEPVDIIVILNESVFNPSALRFIQHRNFEMFQEHDSNLLEVRVFGGQTWNTQFQMLSGIDLEFFKAPVQHNPYLLLRYHDKTLPHILKHHNYQSFAITNMPRRWSAQGENFLNYGFNEYYDVEAIARTQPGEGLCDKDEKIVDHIQNILRKDSGQNKFIYVETMCNHGPHKKDLDIEKVDCGGIYKETCSQMVDYLSRLDVVDRQMQKLMNFVKARKKKTLLVFFGDHYPSFEGNMMPLLKKHNKNPYHTFYTVKSNFEFDRKTIKPRKASEMQEMIMSILQNKV